MKVLKYAAIAFGTLVSLALVGVLVLWLTFDPNDYKGTVQDTVRAQLGRELSLPGRISLSFYPDIALQFGPAMLGNAPGFGSEPMLQIEGVRLGLKLWPLFSKRVEVTGATISRPVVRLQVDAAGRDNWSDMLEHIKQGRQAPAAGGGSSLNISIASLRIEDGRLEYADARSQAATPLSLDLTLQSKLAADTGHQRYRLEAPVIAVRARGSRFPVDGLPLTLRSPSLDVDLVQQTLDWPGLQADIGGAKLEATLQVRALADSPQFSGTLALADLSPRDWMATLGLAPPVTRDPAVLKHLTLRGDFTGNAQRLGLGSLDARLDDSQLTGTFAITDFDTLAMQFDLQVNQLNVDRYHSPVAARARPETGTSAATRPVELPLALLRALDMQGTLRVAQATFAGVQFNGLRVGLEAAHGRLHLAPLEAGLYGGQYRGDISVDATALPRVSFNERITGVDFARLAKDWLDTNKLSGRGSLGLKATASGKDSDALLRTLTGSLSLNVESGAYEGKDILYEIRRARALLKKEPRPVRTGPERTTFSQLSATGTVNQGVLTSNDLVAATQVMRATGKGSVNLVAGQIDYRLDVALLRAAEGRELPNDLADTVGLVVPVRITGPLSDPVIRPDVEALIKAAAQQKFEEKKQELEQRLREKLGETLKDLFGR